MAGADINVKIALDGERGYREALKNCNDSLKTAQSALKLFDEQTKDNANNLETLQEREKKLQDVLEKAKEKYDVLNTALENAKDKRDAAAEAVEKAKELYGDESKEVEKAEKAYEAAQNQVDRYQTNVNKAATEVEKINGELKDNDKYLDEAKDSADGCATSIDEYGNKVKDATDETGGFNDVVKEAVGTEALTKIMGKVSDAFKKVSDAAKEANQSIETGLKNVVKKTGATGDELDKFRSMAEDLFTKMPVSIENAADAIGEVATRFKGLTDNELADLSEKFLEFATLNDTDVTKSIDNVQTALYSFGLEADSAEDYLEVLTVTSQNTGADVDDLATKVIQNASAFHDMGLDIYEATNFLGELEIAGADSSQVMQGMKTALKNAADEGKPLDEVLSNLQETILNSTTDTEGLNAAYDIFGTKAGPAVFNAVKNGQIDFTNLADSTAVLTEANGKLDQSYEDSLTVYDKMQIAQNNLDSALSTLRGSFNEALTPAIETATGWIKDITEGFKNLPPEIQTTIGVITTIGGTALEQIPKIVSLLAQIKLLKTANKDVSGSVSGLGGSFKNLAGKAGIAAGALAAIAAGTAYARGEIDKATEASRNLENEMDGLKSGYNETHTEISKVNEILDSNMSKAEKMAAVQELLADAQSASASAASGNASAVTELNNAQEVNASTGADLLLGMAGISADFLAQAEAVAHSSNAYEDSNEVMETTSEDVAYLESVLADLEAQEDDSINTTEDAADAFGEFGKDVGKTATDIKKSNGIISDATRKMAEKIGSAVNNMKGSLQGAAQSVSDWFGEVAEQEAKSADVMAENLQAQIDSMKNWQENLSYLADKGINQDLLQYLANMGPSGANYVQAFVDAANGKTEVGLDEMNRLWAEKLDLEAGVNKEAEDVYRAIGTLAAGSEDQLKQAAIMAGKAGEELPEEYADGIRSAAPKAYDAARTAAQNAKDGVESIGMYSPGYDVGNQLMNGIRDGVAKNAYKAEAAISNVSRNMITIAKNIPMVSSPSKVFAEIGKFLDMGLAQGIDKYSYMPDRAMTDTMKDLVQMPDLSRYGSASNINNQVAVYIGDKELTAIMAAGVVKNISSNQRAQYVASGGR